MTLSQATAAQGTEIFLSPTGSAALPVNMAYVHVSTLPQTNIAYDVSGTWSFIMPGSDTTVSGVFKQDPELEFSKASATAYMTTDGYDYDELPELSYVSGFQGGIQYSATGASSYVNDIVFVGDKPTVPSESSAYAYIWSNDGSIEATVVAETFGTDSYYQNSAEYTLTLTKQ